MKYECIKQFTGTTKCSKSKIYRFYKVNEELFAETKKKGKRLFPVEHARYFDSEKMFEENKLLRKDSDNLKSLINCLSNDKDGFLTKLWMMDWTLFCTVAYVDERNQQSCSNQMRGLYNYLESKFKKADLRLFFTTEKFSSRDGSHNHFILYASNNLQIKIMKEIKDYFSFDRTDIKLYDKMKAGVFYIAKDGLTDVNWDLLGNNLGNLKRN